MIELTAIFIGCNSCGFKNGVAYDLWLFQKNGKYYLSKRDMEAIAVPYDSMNAIQKNWLILAIRSQTEDKP